MRSLSQAEIEAVASLEVFAGERLRATATTAALHAFADAETLAAETVRVLSVGGEPSPLLRTRSTTCYKLIELRQAPLFRTRIATCYAYSS